MGRKSKRVIKAVKKVSADSKARARYKIGKPTENYIYKKNKKGSYVRSKITAKRPKRSTIKTIRSKATKPVRTAKRVKRIAKTSTRSMINKAVRKVEKKGVKVTKTALKKMFDRTEGVNLSKAPATVLKQYIKDQVKIINASLPTMNNASKRAVREAMKTIGEGKIAGTLSDVTSGLTKTELFENARLLESIVSGDGVSTIALIRRNLQTVKQYEKFIKGPTGSNMENLSFEDYNEMVDNAGKIQDILKSHGNSDQYMEFDLLWNYREFGYKTIGDIFEKVYNDNLSKGLSTDELYDIAIKEIQDTLGKRP